MNILDAATLATFAGIVRGTGEAVTFTHTTPGAHDPAADTFGAPATVSIGGYAIEVPDRPERWEAGELVAAMPAHLFFWPDAEGQMPPKGASCTWAGTARRVDEVTPLRPAGVAVACRVWLV